MTENFAQLTANIPIFQPLCVLCELGYHHCYCGPGIDMHHSFDTQGMRFSYRCPTVWEDACPLVAWSPSGVALSMRLTREDVSDGS